MKPVHFRMPVPLLIGLLLVGCVPSQKDALKLAPTSLSERQLQTRVYEGVDETEILSACVAILQDLGVKISEVETELGLIVGEKMRGAKEADQIAGAIFLALFGASAPIDDRQKIKFSLVTTPVGGSTEVPRWQVRLTIQRIVWNTSNHVSRVEPINDVDIFVGFFDKLNKSLFLEQQS